MKIPIREVPPLARFMAFVVISVASADDALIDSCVYQDNAAARMAWQATGGSEPAGLATVEDKPALRLPCRFAGTDVPRGSWDRALALDLSGCEGVQFDWFCRDPAPVGSWSIYFKSGDGWYHATFAPEEKGAWQTVCIPKSATRAEGTPAGWAKVEAIRVSAWRGSNEDTEFHLRNLRKKGVLGVDARVAILRADSLKGSAPGEARAGEQFAETTARIAAAAGIGTAVVSDLDATPARLRAASVVVLPHNPTLPAAATEALGAYVRGGGKLLVFYNLPSPLPSLLGIKPGSYVRGEATGGFATIRVANGALPGAAAQIGQASWNIQDAAPADDSGRVIARWFNAAGKPTGHNAVVGTKNGIFMSHVLLEDDFANKQRLLLAMLGQLAPEVWKDSARTAIGNCGRFGGFKGHDEVVAAIGREARAKDALAAANQLRGKAHDVFARGDFPAAHRDALAANAELLRAWCLAQSPEAGEFRGFWCHDAHGVGGMDWDAAIRLLKENGFNSILPNMLWAGVAFHPSELLPEAPDLATRGDQVAQCLAACRKHGVRMHVWKVNWNLGHHAPGSMLDKLRREKRLQADAAGKEEPWLCPSDPRNQQLEIDSMVDVARRYAVDGLHFDYIRYPDSAHCFCDGCRERFAAVAGVGDLKWPQDVADGGRMRDKWFEWRRGHITEVVRAVSERARAVRPGIQLSAAVFRNWPQDRDSIGQDWKLWCDQGWLDFVCPMDYTTSPTTFENMVARQLEWTGKTPCYPGIGAHELDAAGVIQQILATRRQRTGGFTVFNYGPREAREIVPLLGAGITAPR